MLWYKSWLETRWRFLIGMAVLICSAAGTVLTYPQVMKLMPLVPRVDVSGELGRRIKEAVDLSREYRGYIWSQWFRQNLVQMWTVFAVLLGTGGLLSRTSGGSPLYTLSLPISRTRVIGIRAATGLVELLALALAPSLVIPLLSPAVGASYSFGDALVHAACLFVAGTAFFSVAFVLSTIFHDLWRPLLLALAVAAMFALYEQVFHDTSRGLFTLMTGEKYFRTGRLPWAGLIISAAASTAMIYGAVLNIAHQDF
jgi:ABC-type transport system involved in multi-copper enzyme maturation permease subunit